MNWNPMMGPLGAAAAPQSPDLGSLAQAFAQQFQPNQLGAAPTLGNEQAQDQYRQMAEAFAMQQRAAQDQDLAASMMQPQYAQDSGGLGSLAMMVQAYAGKKIAKRASADDAEARERYYKGQEADEARKAERKAAAEQTNIARRLEILQRGDQNEILANGIELPKGEQYKPEWRERTNADGSTEFIDLNGGPQQQAPQQARNTGAAAGLDQPGYGAAQFDPEQFYAGVGDVVGPLGGRITSTSGGKHKTGSKHYDGRAIDIGMARESPEQQQAIMDALAAQGYNVRDERTRPAGQEVWGGPHLHVEPGAQAGGQQEGPRRIPGSAAKPKTDKPSTVQQRKRDLDEMYASGVPITQAQAQGYLRDGKFPGEAPAEAKKENAGTLRNAQVGNVERGISRIEQALNALEKNSWADTGVVDQWITGQTDQGRELKAAVGAIQNSMLGLTRVPGIGSQSDLEAKIAALQYPSIDMPMATNRETVKNLRALIRDLGGQQAPQASNDDDLINKYLRP